MDDTYDSKFGPSAQTPEQRAWVLAQMQAIIPGLKKGITDVTRQLHTRYIAGEISWEQMRQESQAQ